MFEVSDVAGDQDDFRRSDYQADQFPAYLLPDGTWRFGENARMLAESAWAFRNQPRVSKSATNWQFCDH
jgi:hypothetical protein